MEMSNKVKKILYFTCRILLWSAITYIYATQQPFLEKKFIANLMYGSYVWLSASILISIGRLMLVSVYRRRHKNESDKNNFVLGMNQLALISNVVFIVLSIMYALGINPKEFLTSITIVAMAIALIFREYITNMISGLLIMFSNQFSLGDHIKVGEHNGTIIDITLANIILKNEEDQIVLVPNNLAFSATFINYSVAHNYKLMVKFELPLQLAQKDKELEHILQDLVLLQWANEVLPDSVLLQTAAIEKHYIKYKATFTLTPLGKTKIKAIESSILQEIAVSRLELINTGQVFYKEA